MCCFFRYCRCLELENCPPREILCLPLAQFLGILPIQHTFCWGGGRQHTAAYRSPRPGIKFLPPQQGQHWLLNLLSREGTPRTHFSLFVFFFLAVHAACRNFRARKPWGMAATTPNPQPLGIQGTPQDLFLFISLFWGVKKKKYSFIALPSRGQGNVLKIMPPRTHFYTNFWAWDSHAM